MLMVRFAVVTDQLPSSDHLTHSEEAQNLGKDDSSSRQLSGADVSDAAQDCFRLDGACQGAGTGGDCARVSENIDERLEVGLELGDGTV